VLYVLVAFISAANIAPQQHTSLRWLYLGVTVLWLAGTAQLIWLRRRMRRALDHLDPDNRAGIGPHDGLGGESPATS